mgnify:CR=1 FL=1
MDTDAGRKGSPVILAEKPMPILFMERARPSASICDRDKDIRIVVDASCVEVFMNGGKDVFSTRFYPEKDQYTASDPGTDADGKQG